MPKKRKDLRMELVKRILKYARRNRTIVEGSAPRYGSPSYYNAEGSLSTWRDIIGYLETLQMEIHEDMQRKVVHVPMEDADEEVHDE